MKTRPEPPVHLDRRSNDPLGQGFVFQGRFSSLLPGFLIELNYHDFDSGNCREMAAGWVAARKTVRPGEIPDWAKPDEPTVVHITSGKRKRSKRLTA
jgi:hypothetical protein